MNGNFFLKAIADWYQAHNTLLEEIIKHKGLEDNFEEYQASSSKNRINTMFDYMGELGLIQFAYFYIELPTRYVEYSDDILNTLLINLKRYHGTPYIQLTYSLQPSIADVKYLGRLLNVAIKNNIFENKEEMLFNMTAELVALTRMINEEEENMTNNAEFHRMEYNEILGDALGKNNTRAEEIYNRS